jgi:hypothetical protein
MHSRDNYHLLCNTSKFLDHDLRRSAMMGVQYYHTEYQPECLRLITLGVTARSKPVKRHPSPRTSCPLGLNLSHETSRILDEISSNLRSSIVAASRRCAELQAD